MRYKAIVSKLIIAICNSAFKDLILIMIDIPSYLPFIIVLHNKTKPRTKITNITRKYAKFNIEKTIFRFVRSLLLFRNLILKAS